MNLAKYIDHTYLKADAKKEDIVRLCKEAKENGFMTVCINPCNIKLAKKELQGSDVKICTVIGFPLGQMTTQAKVAETEDALANGADEIDMVINIGRLKDRDLEYVTSEIKAIKDVCKDHILKVIIETCLLDEEEKRAACKCIVEAGADYVKTSTGFSLHGATFEDVALLKQCVSGKCKVKAAGGVRTHADFLKMIELGADRIGTSSGVKLIKED